MSEALVTASQVAFIVFAGVAVTYLGIREFLDGGPK